MEDNDVKMGEHDTGPETHPQLQEEEPYTITRYEQVDELFGHIYGIERTLLIDPQEDSLLNLIEKIALIPENKLVLVEPMTITKVMAQGPQKVLTVPKIKGVISIYDVFTKMLSND